MVCSIKSGGGPAAIFSKAANLERARRRRRNERNEVQRAYKNWTSPLILLRESSGSETGEKGSLSIRDIKSRREKGRLMKKTDHTKPKRVHRPPIQEGNMRIDSNHDKEEKKIKSK